MKQNEYHHMFLHRSGTWYLQWNGAKKCLRTKNSEEAKSKRDSIMSGKPLETPSVFGFAGVKSRTIYEASDGTLFEDSRDASEYERACVAGMVRLSVSSGVDRLFGSGPMVSEELGKKGLDGFLSELAITDPRKIGDLAKLLEETLKILAGDNSRRKRKEEANGPRDQIRSG